MKNSLVKFLDFESREHNPSVQVGTQPVVIQRDSELMEDMCRSELSVCTPLTETPANAGQPYDCNSRENLHLLLITDDMSFINSQIQLLRKRGIKAVHLPSIYDMQNILPFLLINDHSILIIKNPRKDVLGMLKQIIRTGQFNKQKVNLTVWVIIDVTIWLDKLVTNQNGLGEAGHQQRRAKKTIKDLIDKEFTIDFCQLFDVILDVTQLSNLGLLGSKYLYHQENYMVDAFLKNLEEPSCYESIGKAAAKKEKSLFDFRGLKCYCSDEQQQEQREKKGDDGYVLSTGETFIQYYYLCQRKVHQQYEQSYMYPGESFRVSEKTKMSLSDVVKVKKLADNINFLRLFFLKNNQSHLSQRRESDPGKSNLEVIDCVLAIFLFELTRAFRASTGGQSAIYSKDQFTYKILHFFSTLRLAKEVDHEPKEGANNQAAQKLLRRRTRVIEEDSDEDLLETDADDEKDALGELITGMKLAAINEDSCLNCKLATHEISNFKVLYKTLIETVITNL